MRDMDHNETEEQFLLPHVILFKQHASECSVISLYHSLCI